MSDSEKKKQDERKVPRRRNGPAATSQGRNGASDNDGDNGDDPFPDWAPPSPERAFRGYDEPLLPEMEIPSDREMDQVRRPRVSEETRRAMLENMLRWQENIRQALAAPRQNNEPPQNQQQEEQDDMEPPPALLRQQEEALELHVQAQAPRQEDQEQDQLDAFEAFFQEFRARATEPRPRVRESRFGYSLFLARIRAYGSMSRSQLDDVSKYLTTHWTYLAEVFNGEHGNIPAQTRCLIEDVKKFTPNVKCIVWTRDPTTNEITQHPESTGIDKKTMKRKDIYLIKAFITLKEALTYHIQSHNPQNLDIHELRENFPLDFDLSSDGISPEKSGVHKMHVTSISFHTCGSVLPIQVFWGTNTPDCNINLGNLVQEINEMKHLLVLRRSIHDGAERKIVLGMRNVNHRMVRKCRCSNMDSFHKSIISQSHFFSSS